jgi:hypothetical protein
MIRAPSYLDDNTSTFARTCPGFGKTAAQMALAIEVYRTPLWKRIVWAFCRHGWATGAALLVASVLLSGCTDDLQAHADVQADLADAIATAAKGGIHE